MTPGTKLGPFEIIAPIGAGGMGEVYKARDTKLGREVALKILPPEFAKDPARRQRFVQEAKSASALNHPNIITIYDIDTSDGVDFIAMEYVAGRTVDRLIPKQGMRTPAALRYAVQIADALAAAHAAGIIHRDLKPGNLMVTDSGLVKVLDFGLAKLTEKTGPAETTETMGPPSTEEGHILGTTAYMSPEQAQGLKLDARSDIFSFGAVLYEMLTGRRAFSGDTKMSTLAAILNREPQPLTPTTPRELDRIVTRCLRKDRARRFQTMADLKVALEELKEESDSGRLEAPAIPPRRDKRHWAIVVAAIIMAAIMASGGLWLWNSRERTTPIQTHLRQLTYDAADTGYPALSPDAKLVAYQSDRSDPGKYDIWVQQTAGGPAIRITKDADAQLPVFSADGSKIYFTSWAMSPQGIYELPALGGEPRLIAADAKSPSSSPDGGSIAYHSPTSGQLYILRTAGGQPRSVAAGFLDYEDTPPIWSPDNRHILFLGYKIGHPETYEWWVAPVEGGSPELTGWQKWSVDRGAADGDGSAWLPGDFLVFWQTIGDTTRIYRARFARTTWRFFAGPEALTFGTADDRMPSVASGKMAFQSGTIATGIWSLPADTNAGRVTGPLEKLTIDNAEHKQALLTQDGRSLVYSSRRGGKSEILLRNMRSGEERVIATGSEEKILPLINSDGSRVLFAIPASPLSSVYEVSANGGPPRKLCDNCGLPMSWSQDGRQFLSNTLDTTSISLVDIESGRATLLLQRPQFALPAPRFSPDGKWIAFLMTQGGGGGNIVVAPFRGATPVQQQEWITVASDNRPGGDVFWSPNGDLIYYTAIVSGRYSIKAQHLDKDHHAIGPLFTVYEFSARVLPSRSDSFTRRLTAVPGHIIGTMYERTSNIWMMDLPN
jgi:serine/threonine protein kinase